MQKDTISDLGLPYPDCVTLLLRHKGGVQGVRRMWSAARLCAALSASATASTSSGREPQALYEFKDGDKRPVNTYASFEHDSRYSDNIVENAYVDD